MIIAPRTIVDFENMELEELIKEKHKIMKKIISLEKEIYLMDSDIVEDPSPEIILNKYNEELDIISTAIEEKIEKSNKKGIYI